MNKKPDYPLRGIAKLLESRGRYGDSVLVHMNPVEVQGLASLSPTGSLTTNPDTGQPEAFLPLLVPMLASWGGTAAAGALGAGAIGSAVAGGLASGVATGAMTGDWERGLMSGVMGAGMGAALGAAGANAADAATNAATTGSQAATDIASQQGLDILAQNPNVLANAGNAMQPAVGTGGAGGMLSAAGSGVQPFQMPGSAGGLTGTFGQRFAANLKAPFQSGSGLGGELTKQKHMMPMAIGASAIAQGEADDKYSMGQSALRKKAEADRAMGRSDLNAAYRRAQPGYGMAGGGVVRMVNTGEVPYVRDGGNDLKETPTNPLTDLQNNLRGQYNASWYMPRNYMPGFNGELGYFQNDLNNVSVPDYYKGAAGYSENLYYSPYRSPVNRFIDPSAQGNPYEWWQYNANPNPSPYFNPIGGQSQYGSGKGGGKGGSTQTQQPAYGGGKGGQMQSPWGYSGGGSVRMAEGGPPPMPQPPMPQPPMPQGPQEMMLQTPGGPARVTEGGIANVPNEVAQPMTPPQPEEIKQVAMAIAGIMGEQGQQVIDMFIKKYGPDVFKQIREMVLQAINPGAQTEGMVQGPGGGMDDQVPGVIGANQEVAVSPGEYIVPADVVSGLGDGSSDAGATELDRMSENVRMARGGSAVQPPSIDARMVMPR